MIITMGIAMLLAGLGAIGALLVAIEYWRRREVGLAGFFTLFAVALVWLFVADFLAVIVGQPEWTIWPWRAVIFRAPIVVGVWGLAWSLR
jgi:hypothetical protein